MSDDKEQTLGQRRVKAEFNPAKSEAVDEIKNKSSEIIDFLETMRENASGEKQRVISIAQTNVETACMYAVKANFVK